MKIADLIPDAGTLLALEPAELAGALLQVLHSRTENQGKLHRGNFSSSAHELEGYPSQFHEAAIGALLEAWVWLEREGLLAPASGSSGGHGWLVISRRGAQLRNATDVAAYRRAQSLPRALLHPRIASKVYSLFMRGDYDMAIVYAFREVEVFVRERSRLPVTDVGTTLMRRAFNPVSGRLTDAKAVDAERNARADLFAGAIGSYKNPLSHRHVPATAEGTIELLFLASHLLRLVEETVPRRSPRTKKAKA